MAWRTHEKYLMDNKSKGDWTSWGRHLNGNCNPGLAISCVGFESVTHPLQAPASALSADLGRWVTDGLPWGLDLQACDSLGRSKIPLERFEFNFRETSGLCFPGNSV